MLTESPIERMTPNSHLFSRMFAVKLRTRVKKHKKVAITATNEFVTVYKKFYIPALKKIVSTKTAVCVLPTNS